MKKLITIVCVAIAFMFCSNNEAYSQDNLQIGVGVGYGLEVEALGVQAGAVYGFTETIRGAANFMVYFPGEEGLSYWEINANGHYIFMDEDGTKVYGLAGLNYFTAKVEAGGISASNSEIGLNIGGGAELGMSFGSLFAELKYVLGGAEQLAIGAGVRFAL